MTELETSYRRRYGTVLKPLARSIEEQLRDYFVDIPRIDRISARAKAVDRFLEKAAKEEDGKPKYVEPLHQIQDQIGARIVVFYLSDVEPAAELVKRYYRLIEDRDVIPDSEWEFGYFGKHFVSILPSELTAGYGQKDDIPRFFELQIKTLFQHAWSEANHDLGYKPDVELPKGALRRLAFTSAQAWGADRMFDELFLESLRSLNTGEQERR
jgi:putative GTP pyrophosphokinase